ncbi:hypothetical protein [Mesorhizobium sp. KR2-14]|uniref:hypothetical protein n=1 Tax=Mesorhizobium sp. KR2-14 TaxID=3156610 RepID=UPI0032B3B008
MKKAFELFPTFFTLLPRAALLVGLVAGPALAVPAARSGAGATIEAPAAKKTGAGLFLLMSLQRSS